MLSLPTCPGLFYGSSAQDGMLARMRIPGGILTAQQCDAIVDLAENSGAGYIEVTNRANLQIREIHTPIAPDSFEHLQKLGLAAQTVIIDPIRNIMASPTAGIDLQMLIDTRPWVKALDDALQLHPELAALSPKFSVCLDGGEFVSVQNRRNDVVLSAQQLPSSEIGFRLCLNADGKNFEDVGVFVSQHQCIPFIIALAQVYLAYTQVCSEQDRKPRFRHLLANWGVEECLARVESSLGVPLRRETSSLRSSTQSDHHLGAHFQRQAGLSYLGIALPLGRLRSEQMRLLATLTETFGRGTLRLTPWQTLLFPDVSDDRIGDLEGAIVNLGLHTSATRFDSALVACSGRTGCASGLTDTQTHALTLIKELTVSLDQPLNIHLSGCEKSCAQQTPSDVALVGIEMKKEGLTIENYDVYVGTRDSSFGRWIRSVSASEMISLMEQMLQIYQQQRMLDESFKMFVDRHSIEQLQQWFNSKNNQHLVSYSITG